MQLQGVINGNNIKLFDEVNLPDGLQVFVDIRVKPLSLEEKRKLADKLCGSWAKDQSLKPIFDEIKKNRNGKPREVNFDAAS